VRAKTIQIVYDRPNDLIIWDALLPDGTLHRMKYPGAHFGTCMRVCKGRITDKLLLDFIDACNRTHNEFKLTIGEPPPEEDSSLTQADLQSMHGAMKGFSQNIFQSGVQ
jgi:hypothetical protein